MILNIALIALPSLCGLLLADSTRASIALSLFGSVALGLIVQTRRFQVADEGVATRERLLRPMFMFNACFIAFHVLGGTCAALDASGYTFLARTSLPRETELASLAVAQQLMLLGQTGVNLGMVLAGTGRRAKVYEVPPLKPYALTGLALGCLVAVSAIASFPALSNVVHKLLDLSLAAISLAIVVAIRDRRPDALSIPLLLLGLNIAEQLLSGWKASIVWVLVPIAAMLYPLMRRRILVAGAAFVVVWALYIYPFGLALRPMLWYEGVDKDTAATLAWQRAIDLSMEDRLVTLWGMLTLRANDLRHFRAYLNYVPEIHPFYGTAIVSDALIAAVPRVIWHDKPDMEAVSMQRVYATGIVVRETAVSAKPNIYQAGYMSWGGRGVLLASTVCGILMMFCSRLCERWFGGYTLGTCLIYSGLFGSVFSMPSSFEFVIGGLSSGLLMVVSLFVVGRGTGVIVSVYRQPAAIRPRGRILPARAGLS